MRKANTALWAFLFLLLLGPSVPLFAQVGGYQVRKRQLNVADGLSSRETLCLLEDRRGFIWVGTRQGLNRFDGHGFTEFGRVKTDLAFDTIQSMAEDAEGWLWLFQHDGRRGRLGLLHPESGQTRLFSERFGTAPPYLPDSVTAMFAQPDRSVLLIMSDSVTLWRYRGAEGFRALSLPPGWQFLRHLPSGRLLCLGTTGYAVFDPLDGVVRSLPFHPTAVRDVFEARPSTLLALQYDDRSFQLQAWNAVPAEKTHWRFAADSPADIIPPEKITVHTPTGAILLANGVSLFVLAPLGARGPTELYRETFDRAIRAVLVDRRGTIWVATENGLHLYRVEPERFVHLPRPTAPGPVPAFNCRGLWPAPGGPLYIALNDGFLIACDRETGRLLPGVPRLPAWTLAARADGHLWLAKEDLLEYAPGRGVLQTLTVAPGLPRWRIWALCPTRPGCWLIGTERGLYDFDPAASPFLQRCRRLNGFDALAGSLVLQIVPAGDSAYWLATNSGLYRFDERRGITARYWPGGRGPFYLPSANIQFVYPDAGGRLWLATGGQGLICLDPAAEKPREFTRADGLSSNNLYAIYPAGERSLWITGNDGLLQFDKQTHACQVFRPDDGIAQYEFNRLAHGRGADGRLYFGGLRGVTAFYPDSLDHDTLYHVPLMIARAQRYESRAGRFVDVTDELTRFGTLELPGDVRMFRLELCLQDYFYAPYTVYEYRIDREDAWIAADGNEIQFSGLAYGRHTLEIRARGARGQYSENRLRLVIRVPYPLYLRPWFLVLVLVLLSAAGWLGLRRRTRRLLQRQRELEAAVHERTEELAADKRTIELQAAELRQLDEAKSRFFANISHELRTPLTLISGPAEYLLENDAAITSAERATSLRRLLQNSGRLLTLVDELLELSRLDARQVELEERPVDVYAFCRRVFSAFESRAKAKRIEYALDAGAVRGLNLLIDANRLEKILNNLLVNALKFTSAGGTVQMTVGRSAGTLTISVHDTGEGIHADELPFIFDRYYQARRSGNRQHGGVGIGLALAQELVRLMGGVLTVESRWQAGSVFTLRLPEKAAPATADPVPLPPAAASIPPAPRSATPAGTATILVVEDNLDLQEHLQQVLGGMYRLLTATDGQQAWQLLAAESPAAETVQLILSDVMMPNLDGFELLERVKAHPRWRQLPFVMLTARNDEPDRIRGLRLGVDDYLTKPFSAAELRARLANLLQRHARRRQVASATVALPEAPSADEQWLGQLQATVREALLQPGELSVTWLADRLNMSPRNFQRKVRALTGLSPLQYILECRLDLARQLLEKRRYATVREVAFAAGFDTPHHFSRVYERRFGRAPRTYFDA